MPRRSTTRACVATEKDAAAFFEGKGVTVTTPDVAAFREQVLKKFAESDFAKDWPAGMLDRISRPAREAQSIGGGGAWLEGNERPWRSCAPG